MKSLATPARNYFPGIGEAVANRTVNREVEKLLDAPRKQVLNLPRNDGLALDQEVAAYAKSNGLLYTSYEVLEGDGLSVEVELNVIGTVGREVWADVAKRVALGNSLLTPGTGAHHEFEAMHHHLRQASILLSGRHLQHGDETQPTRNMEVFTNCSSSAASFLTFYLLLNGSGVGRSYDDELMALDYRNMPIVVPVINGMHPDVLSGEIQCMSRDQAEHFYDGKKRFVFMVPDSREGWAKALEKIETMTYQGIYGDAVLILDFSEVRCKGSPIKGMQGRPSSGPGPLMSAIEKYARLKWAQMAPWRAAMYADHYLSECVLVGGARRAARMSCKTWRDRSVLEFISVKRGGHLWTSNNSVLVDKEFWDFVECPIDQIEETLKPKYHAIAFHAHAVFDAVCQASYFDGTGEPGFINQDKLTRNDEGIEAMFDGDFAKSSRYSVDDGTKKLMGDLARRFAGAKLNMIVNPCGEIPLSSLGAYCVIADVVPFHAANDADAEDSFRVATRALIRTNLMNSLYQKEVNRTNRIGVGMTGLHEYAMKRFGYGFRDIIDEVKSLDFWRMIGKFKRAVQGEAESYAKQLGVTVPHTNTTIKPAGTTSKLFGLTEGAHLPAMLEYLRWVQFRNDDPLVEQYRSEGYPIRKLQTYSGTTIVGFPTRPMICQLAEELGLTDKLITAAQATPEEQYQYLRLMDKYWLRGVDEAGEPLAEDRGGQVSYTLKYDPKVVSFADFKRTMLEGQSTVRCCSVMPQEDKSAYEYLPEQAVSKHEYEQIAEALARATMKEDVDLAHVDCGSGACPIDFNKKAA